MKNNKTIYLTIGIVIVLALLGLTLMADSGDSPDQAESASFSGSVVDIDASEIAVDGPYRIEVETTAGESRTVLIPSMGINLCPAQDNITSPDELAVGDEIEARGSLGSEAGTIVVCDSLDDYLRPAGE